MKLKPKSLLKHPPLPFTLCFDFSIYTRRSPPEGRKPNPRLFPSDVVCHKCVKEYKGTDSLCMHFKGNLHTSSGRNIPHLECEKFWNAYSDE